MIIVGIMGGIAHGKTTFAEALKQAQPKSKHIENSELIAEIVNEWQSHTPQLPDPAKPDDVKEWLNLLPAAFAAVSHQQLDGNLFEFDSNTAKKYPELYEKLYAYLFELQKKPGLLHAPITPANKSGYRPILQWLGGYAQVKLPPGFWFRELVHRVRKYDSEGIELGILGGVRFPADVSVIKSEGGEVLLIERPLPRELDANDPTEQARKLIIPDTTVHNDAGLDELEVCARNVYADLKSGLLKSAYYAGESGK